MKIKEEQIRPAALFDEYLRLAELDAKWLAETCQWETIKCWACESNIVKHFVKLQFHFGECPSCRSIIANPRPSGADVSRFYSEGQSPKFWASDFYKVTSESRRELLWKAKALEIANLLRNRSITPDWLCDIGAGYGIFIEEIRKVLPGIRVVAIEPTPALANELRSKNIATVEKFLSDVEQSDLPAGRGFFTSFELLEHLQNPLQFLRDVRRLCQNNTSFLATTLSAWGLDIQLLQEKSKAIFPPHHLQILSPKAMKGLAAKSGFQKVSVTTPGKLDVDICYKNLGHISDRFWQIFLRESSDEDKSALQELLAKAGFSSHMWCFFES